MRTRGRAVGVGLALAFALAALAPAAVFASPVPRPAGPDPVAPAPPGLALPTTTPFAFPASPLIWLTAAQTTGRAVKADHGALEQLGVAKSAVRRAQGALRRAQHDASDLGAQRSSIRDQIAQLIDEQRRVMAQERQRAIRAYITGGDVPLDDLFSTASVDDAARRAIYAGAAQGQDQQRLGDIAQALSSLQQTASQLDGQLTDAQHAIDAARDNVTRAQAALTIMNAAVSDVTHGGRVFPVEGKYDFVDSWGAYRADLGAANTHAHHATDIMSPLGTPVVAVESGTLDRIGWNALGGWRLWIKGDSGANYYYAHMSAYAPGLLQNMHVVAGQYLGRVGNTGNAQGGPTHLHFEVHVRTADGHDKTVNPYPLLCLLAGAPVPPIPPDDPPPPPPTSSTSLPPSATTSTTGPR